MSRTLTPLELDFLGDLCEEDHQIWQVFEFVGLYHNSISGLEIFESGRKLLLDWLQQGWIDVVETKNRREKMGSEALANFFDRTGISLMTQFDSTVWIEITSKGEEIYASSKPANLDS
jgi:hypothetical protein